MLDQVFINSIRHVNNFQVLLFKGFQKWGFLDFVQRVSAQNVNAVLPLLHVFNVFGKRNQLAVGLGSLVSDQLHEFAAVGFVLNDTELDIGRELFVPFEVSIFLGLVVFLDIDFSVSRNFGFFVLFLGGISTLLGKFTNEVKSFAGQLLLDNLENLVFLEGFAIHIEWKLVRVDDTIDETEVLGQQTEFITNQNTSNVEPYGALDIFNLTHLVRWGLFTRKVENGTEVDVTLGIEMRPSGGILHIIVVQQMEKVLVFFVANGILVASPNGFVGVEGIPSVSGDFFHLLGLFFFFVLDFQIIFVSFGFVVQVFFFVLLFLILLSLVSFLVFNFDFHGAGGAKLDGVGHEFRVMGGKVLETSSIQIFRSIIPQVQCDFGTSLERVSSWIFKNREIRGAIDRFPNQLRGTGRVTRSNRDTVGNKETTVETNTELPNLFNGGVRVASLLHGFDELAGSRASDGSQVFHQFFLGHTNTRITNCQGFGFVIVFNVNFKVHIFSRFELFVSQRQVTVFVESIGSIGDELSQEDLLVLVQRVNHNV
mmetsp:Transcript_10205/g.21062  ORF Transcript_10205/g.21062 Transcript_10205/m.21062 type:complete len:538 (-) Transcript_10205:37-1650(-)